MMVDDAAFMRKVIKDTLSKAGYTDLHEAEDGAMAALGEGQDVLNLPAGAADLHRHLQGDGHDQVQVLLLLRAQLGLRIQRQTLHENKSKIVKRMVTMAKIMMVDDAAFMRKVIKDTLSKASAPGPAWPPHPTAASGPAGR